MRIFFMMLSKYSWLIFGAIIMPFISHAEVVTAQNTAESKTTTVDIGVTEIEPFGGNLFNGNFLKTRQNGLNPNYIVAPGDRVAVNVWGVVNISGVQEVDGQGNIFLPEIGPVKLAGVKNADLTTSVRRSIQQVYTGNFNVYTNLVTAQPVAVFVTGMVTNPGRYEGVPSDSVLYFLDLAGGIDPLLGSYRNIDILRNGENIATIDLYDFIRNGTINTPQLEANDTILVKQRGEVVQLDGTVARSKMIELKAPGAKGEEILQIIPKTAQATEVTLSGMRQGVPFKHSMSVSEFLGFGLADGDRVTFRDDGRSEAILISVEGENAGPSVISVKRGARLVEVLNYIPVDTELADIGSIYIRRKSVATAQKDAINDSLFRLERSALLALSGSQAEQSIRVEEAKLIETFVEKAKLIDPLGRVVTTQNGVQQNILLEPEDVIVIPTKTQIVRINGEVLMIHAVTYREGWSVDDYVAQAGGYTDRADRENLIVHRPNAEVVIGGSELTIQPGDEIIVPPRVDKKTRQYTLDLVDIIYKIAIAAKVAFTI